jgi:hypothetical protein
MASASPVLFPTFQDAFDELYIGSSSREKGTLFYIKNYFNHRNVTNNVKVAFNYDEEFLQFCTDSYIVLAGMHCMDIAEINETPDDFPLTKDEKLRYLHHISSLIVDMLYISSQPMVQKILQTEEPSNETYPICICYSIAKHVVVSLIMHHVEQITNDGQLGSILDGVFVCTVTCQISSVE